MDVPWATVKTCGQCDETNSAATLNCFYCGNPLPPSHAVASGVPEARPVSIWERVHPSRPDLPPTTDRNTQTLS